MMTAQSMLSKRPLLIFTLALFFYSFVDFIAAFNPGKKKHRLEGIKIYPNVQIEFPKLSSKGIPVVDF